MAIAKKIEELHWKIYSIFTKAKGGRKKREGGQIRQREKPKL